MNFETFKDLTRIEHTLFGLPFILTGGLISLLSDSIVWTAWWWLVPAFLMARFAGMAFNQLIDRQIDALNPRTQYRALPTGRVSVKEAAFVAWGSLILLVLICLQINLLCFYFSFLAASLLAIYSYLKRVHAVCHFVLGSIHFLGPLMASIALLGKLSWPPFFLGCAAFALITGNDIVYAIQDFHFDVENKLHSLPARKGIAASLKISCGLHAVLLLALILVGLTAKLPLFYYGVLIWAGCILIHFHSSIAKQYHKVGTVKGIESLFFFSNTMISFAVLVFVSISVLWRVL